MEYPSIPMCMASKTQKRKMQTLINESLKFIHCNERYELNREELHMKYNITPLSLSNYFKAQKYENL